MPGTVFQVGKDEIPIANLTFDDVRSFMEDLYHQLNSPLGLHFRFLPDESVLMFEHQKFQPRLRQGVWDYSKMVSLGCYESLVYTGSSYRNDRSKYSGSGTVWRIKAHYAYEIEESEALPNSNPHFTHHGRPVYQRTEQPGKRYELVRVEIEDRSNKILDFLAFYSDLRRKIASPKTWIDEKFDLEVPCVCGHRGFIRTPILVPILSKTADIDSLKSRLRCQVCNRRGVAAAFPTYSKQTPKHLQHTAWLDEKGPSTRPKKTSGTNSELKDMYQNLGGDGENEAYLSDGAYLSREGDIRED